MARFYFHVKRGRMTVLDHEGADLTGINEALKEATRRAQAMNRRKAGAPSGAIVIADDWQTVMEIPF